MLRWMQVQADDLGRFSLKVRVVRRQVALESMRPQGMLAPHASHHHVADAEVCRELARAPLRRTIRRLTLDRPLQNPRLQRRRQRARLLPRVSAEQPRQSLRHKALAPPIDKAVRAVQLVADRCPRLPGVEQQDQPRPARFVGAAGLTGGALHQFRSFHFRQHSRVTHEHDYTRFSVVTGH